MSVLSESVSKQVQSQLADTVIKLPMQFEGGIPSEYFGMLRVSEEGKRQQVGQPVKAGYVPHTVDDVAVAAEAAAIGFKAEHDAKITAGWTKNGQVVVVAPSNDQRREICKNDGVFPRAIIRADYGRAFRASFGMYRDLCTNLSMIRQVSSMSFTFRHTASLRTRLDEMVQDFRDLSKTYDTGYEIACKLHERRVAVSEYLTAIYPAPSEEMTERAVNSHKRRAEAIVTRLLNERQRTEEALSTEPSLWHLMNAVTGYIQHDQRRRGNLSAFDRAIKAIDEPLSSKAWDVAIEMAG